ncbi:transferrin-binding protein-like solute binding protein [Limimaricola variabilis]|uniref:transferrin-binding protein-like solute binding protein n=1 Tax=Limimaricola variabilis TaxID=1492771 RepID=UPI002AC8C545|nr:transferrin-binding protein-like solute binding protein [Limimaricola variabilis]WPY93998.1 transferrin-binding protein-like solute binding protein [Limimaricola variabilis]
MSTILRLSAAALLPLALAACGGASTGDASFETLKDEGFALAERLEGLERTAASDMPTRGKAQFVGKAGFYTDDSSDIEDAVTLVSNVALNADFGARTIEGEMTGFEGDIEGSVIEGGRIAVTNGRISGNEFDADLNGRLQAADAAGDVTGGMNGTFRGAQAQALEAEMGMSIRPDGMDHDFSVFGALVAERD